MNHSDFATWLVMALPLTAGYLIARLHSRRAHGGLPAAVAEAFDNTAMWLTTAIGLMAAGARRRVVAIGADRGRRAGSASLWVLSAARMRRQGRAWLLAGFGAIALVARRVREHERGFGQGQTRRSSWGSAGAARSGAKRCR